MSVSSLAHPPRHAPSLAAFWLAILFLAAVAIGFAWLGAGSLRPEVTASGLQFRAVAEGTGEPIAAEDAAILDYVLTLDDGTVMDASQAHGGPQPFTMAQVFPGFAEAMTKMREGGRYHFTMPKELAFPAGQTPPGFTGDNLTFDVEVRQVVRGGASMMPGAQGAPPEGRPPGAEPPQQP